MADAAEKLYTLTQVSQETDISMPTLQRYKKLYQDRIPSKGKGRSQRYPKEALDVFRELKKENIGRRGRPRKTESAKKTRKPRATKSSRGAKKTTAAKKSDTEGLLTLTQIGKMTNISYPTLLRYVKTSLDEIPHRGTGRARRFLPEAVDVFKRLRSESKRGRQRKGTAGKAKSTGTKSKTKTTGQKGRKTATAKSTASIPSDLLGRIKSLEKANKDLRKSLDKLEKRVNKPYRVVLQR